MQFYTGSEHVHRIKPIKVQHFSFPWDLMKSSCQLDENLSSTTSVLFQQVYQLLANMTSWTLVFCIHTHVCKIAIVIGKNKEKEISATQGIHTQSLKGKNKYGYQMHAIYAYYCWAQFIMGYLFGVYIQNTVAVQLPYMYHVAGIFVQGHRPIMWNVCVPLFLVLLLIQYCWIVLVLVFLVIMLIPVSSYEVYILTWLSDTGTWSYWHVGFEGHIWCGQIYGDSIVIKVFCVFCLFWLLCAVVEGLYVDYSCGEVGHICEMLETYCSGIYTNNVKYVYSSVLGHIIDCSEFMWFLYTDIAVSYVHIN